MYSREITKSTIDIIYDQTTKEIMYEELERIRKEKVMVTLKVLSNIKVFTTKDKQKS